MTLNNDSSYTFGDQVSPWHTSEVANNPFDFSDKNQIRIIKVCYNKTKDLTGLIFYD